MELAVQGAPAQEVGAVDGDVVVAGGAAAGEPLSDSVPILVDEHAGRPGGHDDADRVTLRAGRADHQVVGVQVARAVELGARQAQAVGCLGDSALEVAGAATGLLATQLGGRGAEQLARPDLFEPAGVRAVGLAQKAFGEVEVVAHAVCDVGIDFAEGDDSLEQLGQRRTPAAVGHRQPKRAEPGGADHLELLEGMAVVTVPLDDSGVDVVEQHPQLGRADGDLFSESRLL